MMTYKSPSKVEINIHNMKYADAKKYLEQFLSRANGNVKEVTVIHGYSSGTVLRDMVRKDLRHHRIWQKQLTVNPGVTILAIN